MKSTTSLYPFYFGRPSRPYPLFMNLMLATFHQDWDLDTTGDAIKDFIEGLLDNVNEHQICMLAEMSLLKYSKTEEELDIFFKNDLEWSWNPITDKRTNAQFLDELIAAMEMRIYGATARLGQVVVDK